MSGGKLFGVPPVISASDILKGNNKINLIFVAFLFNAKHGLEDIKEDEADLIELVDAAKMIDDDIESSKEERAFRMWINSLEIEDVYVQNLYEEARDGMLLLKVEDRVEPGCVDWKCVEKNPNNAFKRVTFFSPYLGN